MTVTSVVSLVEELSLGLQLPFNNKVSRIMLNTKHPGHLRQKFEIDIIVQMYAFIAYLTKCSGLLLINLSYKDVLTKTKLPFTISFIDTFFGPQIEMVIVKWVIRLEKKRKI